MNVREKLVELIESARYWGSNTSEEIADNLVANGVTMAAYDCHWATEQAYKNGYAQDMKDAAQELALPKEDYYVLRNIETGMYFRGKGENRWGKYFNQATIYRVKGTAEHSIKEVAWHGEKAELVRIKIVEMPKPPKGE